MSVLSAAHLRKRYKSRTVVQDVSLEVASGEVIGLLGPNGAGKTTCFYMMVGLVSADGGSIHLDGHELTHLPIHQRARLGISYLPQENSVFRRLSVEENLQAVLELQGLSGDALEARLIELLEDLNIRGLRKNPAQSLSGGERRRLEIARALATRPGFILLDEPFAGVDPIAVIDIQRIIRFLKQRGIGVLITDHNVRETLGICDRAYIMNDGEIRLRMEKIPGVVRVVTLVEGQAMAASLHSATGALVRGISEADIAQLPSINNEKLTTALMVAGVPDAAASFTGFDAAAGVAIGKRMAWRHRLVLGSTLTIISPNGPETVVGNTPTIRDFQVVAIFDAGMSDYDENVIYMPLAAAKEYFNTEGGVSMIEATIADPEAVDGMVADFAAAAGPDMLVQTWKQRNMTFFDALAVERNVMFLVLTMIILVAALNIISGLIMLVKDKGRDIAILRTMGATRGSVMRIFFLAGASVGVIGTLAGFGLGMAFTSNIETIRQWLQALTGTPLFSPEVYFLSRLPARVDAVEVAQVVIMAFALSFLATIYPAWRAARLDPVEALRYE